MGDEAEYLNEKYGVEYEIRKHEREQLPLTRSLSKPNHAQWLANRKGGIGGSDAAKVLGLSQYGGPLSVFLDKTGKVIEKEMSEAAEMGIELEETVARIFTKRTGLSVQRRNKMFVHPKYPWMIANIDRKINGENKGLECKTAHFMKGSAWDGDDLPDDYYCQCQHYIEVLGWESCYIAALIGGQSFKWKEVQRNQDFIDGMIEAERVFWNEYVLKGIMPPANEHDDIEEIYPENTEDYFIEATRDHWRIAEDLAFAKYEMKRNEAEVDRLENLIKQAIGTSQGMKGIATWKQSKMSVKTDWQKVAFECGATKDVIQKHTESKPGSRRFILDKYFTDKVKKELEAA